jgi:hypothetical protein
MQFDSRETERAHLSCVLPEANPFQDIRNTRRIAAVVLRSTLYDGASLKQILATVQAAPDRQVDDWGRKSQDRK